MAATSLLVLLDDIVAVLDDVALITKTAAEKTAGMLSDDLAVNAGQLSGMRAERELPVVWQVAKGSLLNKLILVPAALLISALAPWLIPPMLVLGGLYLCFEGFENLAEKLFPHHKKTHQVQRQTVSHADLSPEALKALEQKRIRGAIRTDFILSAEIIVVTLGLAQNETFLIRAGVVASIAFFMTVGIYGLVAAIVKLDDLGLYLLRLGQAAQSVLARTQKKIGAGLLVFAPFLMRLLSWIGTLAMFLVGGGILLHELPPLHAIEVYAQTLLVWPEEMLSLLLALCFGLLVGAVAVAVFSAGVWCLGRLQAGRA